MAHFAALLPPQVVRRLAALRGTRISPAAPPRPGALDTTEARAHVAARWGGDLCGLLNAMTRDELAVLARALGVAADGPVPDMPRAARHPGQEPRSPASPPSTRAGAPDMPRAARHPGQEPRSPASPPSTRAGAPALRQALWARGAALERGAADVAGAVQPVPVVLGGHLVVQAPPRGPYPPAPAWPRPVPPPAPARPPADEPDSLDELLAAADRALGVRLGPRDRDKGAWGARAAALLGVIERGQGEPDWRGDVEIKTVPIARDRSGLWRVVEDPAIAMQAEGAHSALAKLQHTLWLARVDLDGDADATLVSWYLLPWDAEIARLAARYLHDRPKGPAGTDQRGLYLHKRFFADAGLLATLNGAA